MDKLTGYRTYIVVAITFVLLVLQWVGLLKIDPAVYAALIAAAVAFLRAGIDNTFKGLNALAWCLFAAFCLSLTGCATRTQDKYGDIVSVTTWFGGMRIMATSASTQTPEMWVGIGRQTVTHMHTSTNQMYAPRFASGFHSDQSAWNPLSMKTTENIAAGDVMIGTNSETTAIVPKLAPPKPNPAHP
jgi:hypothetical protein